MMVGSHKPQSGHVCATLALLATLILISACGQPEPPRVMPTIAPFFVPVTSSATMRVPTRTRLVIPTPMPRPTRAPLATTAIEGRDMLDAKLRAVSVYSDTLATGWRLINSDDVRVDPRSAAAAQTGKHSIAVTTRRSFGDVLFAVQRNAPTVYSRDEIVGFRFQLYSGEDAIGYGELIVSVLGSNDVPYYVQGDESVAYTGRVVEETPTFPETRLYFLDINDIIPPRTWIEIYYDIDAQGSPDYKYITALRIRNDDVYRGTFYIDDVEILYKRDD